jgi:hypothetical protein
VVLAQSIDKDVIIGVMTQPSESTPLPERQEYENFGSEFFNKASETADSVTATAGMTPHLNPFAAWKADKGPWQEDPYGRYDRCTSTKLNSRYQNGERREAYTVYRDSKVISREGGGGLQYRRVEYIQAAKMSDEGEWMDGVAVEADGSVFIMPGRSVLIGSTPEPAEWVRIDTQDPEQLALFKDSPFYQAVVEHHRTAKEWWRAGWRESEKAADAAEVEAEAAREDYRRAMQILGHNAIAGQLKNLARGFDPKGRLH